MLKFAGRRVLTTLPALLGVYTLIFVVLHVLPSDPALMISEGSASKSQLESLRHQYGLDRPLWRQYADSLRSLVQGRLGRSIRYGEPVGRLIGKVLPATLELALVGLGIAVALGVTLGTLAALRPHGWVDNLSTIAALSGVSIPSFWLALMLIFVFSLWLGWLPVTTGSGWQQLIMPAVTLGLYSTGVISRLARSSLVQTLHQEYVVTARAKGLPPRLVVLKHALRNSLIPVVTIVGVELGNLLSGTVVVETVFARPGLGRLIVESITYRDYPALQSALLVAACGYVLANMLVDVSYGYLDPRIRDARAHG
ncbi:MAG TPA: ABC transporter permease [bacterium]|nr:ABC transporter permease [bacterium]